eukprot:TRINITY_DN384_c1_g1_i1.p1 TRINITY_DN384_c1_g1~~TRINITY_DN384_c1_g1_i1.p1  ORF type:complete len:401 (+),score=97.35 TRINITY_DN384_c1_g1_i1:120-1205(+)
MPKMLLSSVDPREFDNKRSNVQITTSPFPISPTDYHPPQEWQDSVLSSFHQLRNELSERACATKPKLPHHNDIQGWRRYCIDPKAAGYKFGDTNNPRPPDSLLDTAITLEEMAVIKLIGYFATWIETSNLSINENIATWLYALFIRLEEPIFDSSASDLRTILLRCGKQRSELPNKEDPILPILNILISIITQCFGQVESYDENTINRNQDSRKRWRSEVWEESQRKKLKTGEKEPIIIFPFFMGGDDDDDDDDDDDGDDNGDDNGEENAEYEEPMLEEYYEEEEVYYEETNYQEEQQPSANTAVEIEEGEVVDEGPTNNTDSNNNNDSNYNDNMDKNNDIELHSNTNNNNNSNSNNNTDT